MNKEKLERVSSMPKLKAEIIGYLFDFVTTKSRDQWWKYKGEFQYEGRDYDLECECKWDNEMFTYRNMHIGYKTIILDVEDVLNFDMRKLMEIAH